MKGSPSSFLFAAALHLLGVGGIGISSLLAVPADPVPPAAIRHEVFQAGDDWTAIQWNPTQTVKGSALDFSRFLDAPAGKYGEVIIRDGKFSYADAPDKTVRFYGTNLTHQAPFMSKADADILADMLAAEGFNAVRLHMNERWLTVSDGATEFNPEQKDKFDYLIGALKKRGIYYVMTIYSGAYFKPGAIKDVEGFADREFQFEMKGLVMVSGEAMDYMHRYSKSLLCSVNPYTGMAPKDDPALIGVELTNENPLNLFKQNYPEFTPIFTQKCREYLTTKNGAPPSDQEVESYYNRFLLELQSRFYNTMKDYLRNDLGVKKPLSDVNCRTTLSYAMVRNEMDYPDVHEYWDLYKFVGAEFGGGMFSKGKAYTAYRLKNTNPIRGHWDTLLEGAAPRIFEKPFSCGEFNTCYPAPERAFTVPLQSALAGLQGWGMLLHYCYASKPEIALQASPERRLNVGTSPLFLLSERIGSAFFSQGEVTESKVKIPLIITPEYIYEKVKTLATISPDQNYYRLGFACQIGTVLVDGDRDLSGYPCVVVPADMRDIPECVRKVKWFRADDNLLENLKTVLPGQLAKRKQATTGQIVLDAEKGAFTVATPKSECLLLSDNVPTADGPTLSVSHNKTAATCFATSLDGAPLSTSKRMLFLYLTDLKNTGTVIDTNTENGSLVVQEQGDLPYLIRQGTVNVAFRLKDRPLPKIWALKYDGTRSVEIVPTPTDTGFSFEAQAVTNPEAFAAYELAWSPED